jgi:hypothetical protein
LFHHFVNKIKKSKFQVGRTTSSFCDILEQKMTNDDDPKSVAKFADCTRHPRIYWLYVGTPTNISTGYYSLPRGTAEMGKITLKVNGDEALSDESV